MLQNFVNVPKTNRGKQTLEKISKAAEQAFGEKGYYNTSMNDIANAAKVAPGTIYIYFADKYSLYCYLLNQYSHAIRMHISIRTKECTSRKEVERIGLLSFLEMIREHKYMYNIIWESLYIDKKLFVEYYQGFGERYEKLLEGALQKGEIKDYDLTVAVYVLMGISNFLGLKYVMFEDNCDLEKVSAEAIRILEEGLFTKEKS